MFGPQEGHWEKRCEIQSGGQEMAVMVGIIKVFIMTIQMNSVQTPSKMWRRQHRFIWIVIIKMFAINLPSQQFLGHHLGFHIFFHNGLLGGRTLFLQLGCFCVRDVWLPILDDFYPFYFILFHLPELSTGWLLT